jgi:type VI secretion system secreted protein VgrG
MLDPSRIDDVRARPYCVQYNESDFAFLSRILEDEGISYHFENGAGTCLLVLSDSDHGKTRLDPFERLGVEVNGRELSAVRLGARLRENAVRLRDFDWRKPGLDLVTEARGQGDLVEYRYPGEFHDDPALGEPLAKARLERFGVEAEYATGQGRCRLLSAGSIFRLEHAKSRYEGEYLVTRLEVRGEQHGVASLPSLAGTEPWTMSLECARRGWGTSAEPSRYHPERVTPKPRIFSTQTAFVTAEPSTQGAEIHVGGPPGAEIGCVRVLFHWDKETERHAKEPASCWVRVSQTYAGAGEGAVCHPRVGNEVIVGFLDGDPDRPIVTGRVYNGLNRPSAPSSGAPTVSTIKTRSSPGGAKFNELAFDDTAGEEAIRIHAGKNWNSEIGHDRTEHVTNNSASSVDVDRTESTGADRSTAVRGNNTESVDGSETITVGGNQATTIAGDQALNVSVNHTAVIGANQSISVGGNRALRVSGNQSESVQGNAEQAITGNEIAVVAGSSDKTVGGSMTHIVAGAVTLSATADLTQITSANLAVSAGVNADVHAGATLSILAGAQAVIQGPSVLVNGDEIVLAAGGSAIRISGAGVEIAGAAVTVAGGTVDMAGGNVKVN